MRELNLHVEHCKVPSAGDIGTEVHARFVIFQGVLEWQLLETRFSGNIGLVLIQQVLMYFPLS